MLPGTSGSCGHLNNLKFKSFENAGRPSRVPGGKQIFTVSLIHHPGEYLIDVVHRRAVFLGRSMAVLMPYLPFAPARYRCTTVYLRSKRVLRLNVEDSFYCTVPAEY